MPRQADEHAAKEVTGKYGIQEGDMFTQGANAKCGGHRVDPRPPFEELIRDFERMLRAKHPKRTVRDMHAISTALANTR